MYTSTVTKKGQTTIPVDAQKFLNVHTGIASQESNIGFADAYIGLIYKNENCTYALTFDKKATTKDFQLL